MTTTTVNKGFVEPAHNDLGWDVSLNAIFTAVDAVFGNSVTINVAGLSGVYNLVLAQYQPTNIILSGAMAGNLVLTIPAGVGGMWSIQNSATGGTVTVASAGVGSTTLIGGSGARSLLICDGANVMPAVTFPSGVSGANPTALIGLTAVNGAAASFMRSDAAPALDQSITPTWTGAHTFSGVVTINPITGNVTISPLAGGVIMAPSGNIAISPSGVLTLSSVAGGQMNNITIGGGTPAAGYFTTLSATGTLTGVDAIMTSTLASPALKSRAVSTPPAFQDSAGTVMGVLCRAWVNFGWNGSTIVVNSSFNVSGVTRISQGVYRVNFTSALPNANYAVSATVSTSAGAVLLGAVYSSSIGGAPVLKTTSSVEVVAAGSGGNADTSNFSVMIFD